MNKSAIYSAESAKGWIPWGTLAPFLAVVLVAAPSIGASIVLHHFHLLDANDDPIGLMGFFAFLLFPFSLIGLVVLAWVHFIERRPLATIGLAGADRAKTFLRGHAIGLATSFAIVAAIWMAGGLRADGYGKAFGSSITLMNMGLLLACFALQSSVEEMVFRGWLLSAIARKFNITIAVVLTSIVFTFLHFSPDLHWLFLVNTFLFSVVACYWARKTGNIWGVMGWHAGWNWLLAIGFELPVTGLDLKLPALIVKLIASGPIYLTGGVQGPEGSFFCGLLLAGASAFLIWRSARDRKAIEVG